MKKPTRSEVQRRISSKIDYFDVINYLRTLNNTPNYKRALTEFCHEILEFINSNDNIIFNYEEYRDDYPSCVIQKITPPTEEDVDREYELACNQYAEYKTEQKIIRQKREAEEKAEYERLKKKYESK